ncbi:ciliary microtubule associated protein 1A-like [Sycon ciliatum]|uniref:ciliary microtubule associated protein 1A-like n=1 Tax=Sycon ciliatum TaxID=27933 RepID=UPI0031F713A6
MADCRDATADDPWRKKRPPVAAMARGPGPACYTLPSLTGHRGHDCSKPVNPAYSIGMPTACWYYDHSGPGPGRYVNPKITRKGKDGAPAFSLYARLKNPALFRTPAPCTYAPEKGHTLTRTQAPAYSLGARIYRRGDTGPAPNAYTLPELMGQGTMTMGNAAAWTLTKRPKKGAYGEDYTKAPGPGAYDTTDPSKYKSSRAPVYSMRRNTHIPGDAARLPGPGAYRPEKVHAGKRRAPGFSFGVRHSDFLCPLTIPENDRRDRGQPAFQY